MPAPPRMRPKPAKATLTRTRNPDLAPASSRRRRRLPGRLFVFLMLAAAGPAMAGPPYDTDDPEPTDRGHWEIYAFAAGDRIGGASDGAAGLDLNYGAAPGVQ